MRPCEKERAPRNRTLSLTEQEIKEFSRRVVRFDQRPIRCEELSNVTVHQDLMDLLPYLPSAFVDLLVIDPPYNLTKTFEIASFRERSWQDYAEWFEAWFSKLMRILKPTATVYICSDWNTSSAVHLVASKYLSVRNRITWEREKGRGASRNWKNCSEDIWFCTVTDEYLFNVEAVKLRRKVIAPYKDSNGIPKDWEKTSNGDFRLTHPSNMWTDITVPFWSMPENTDHPTQKPEKLLAKIILASSQSSDLVFDPFLGSGTTSVVAKKLGRRYAGVEICLSYCCLAEKRLALAESDRRIQGYQNGVFWERNSLPENGKQQVGRFPETTLFSVTTSAGEAKNVKE